MRRVLLGMTAVMLVIAVTVCGLGIAVAQENAGATQPEVLVPALAVEVPAVAQVGELVTITVTDRGNGTAVEGASVYALGWGWPRMAVSNADGFIRHRAYYFESLGRTNGSGEVVHTFDRVGGLLIVATMEGYVPGLARLAVKPDLKGKLEIEAPRRAGASEAVIIQVFERRSGDAVPGADVWAIGLQRHVSASAMTLSTDDVKALLEELEGMGSGNITGMLTKRGVHLGKTGDDGVLRHTFTEVGGYLLVATKSEYVPNLKPVAVVADKALAIHGPRMAGVGGNVTFTVITRGTGTPVEGAALYALPMRSLRPGSVDLPDLQAEGISLGEMLVDWADYLGTTNEAGELQYQFSEVGVYLIAGIKDGYVPGVTGIAIGQFEVLREVLPQLRRFGELFQERPWESDQFPGLKEGLPQLKRFGERIRERLE